MQDYLPWEIVTIEIFSRLPVKSLARFKCLSKAFYGSISNDSLFRKKHLYHQSSIKKVLLVPLLEYLVTESAFSCALSPLSPKDDCKDMTELQLPVRIGEPLHVIGQIFNSCDGLICMGVAGSDVVIWNPTTREVKKLPGCHNHVNSCPSWNIGYSLVYDSQSDVYKLLAILRHFNDTYNLCFYSTEMKIWRYVEDRPPCDFVKYVADCTIVNGAFHWLGSHEEHFKMPHVVSLDISDETFGTLALPHTLSDISDPVLCVLNGKLSVFCGHNSGMYREIWVMKEYGVVDSMTRMFRISRVELPDKCCSSFYMLEDDAILIYGDILTSYYKDGRHLHDVVVGEHKFVAPYVYIESLISPHTILESSLSATTSCGKYVAKKKPWQRFFLRQLCCCKSFRHMP